MSQTATSANPGPTHQKQRFTVPLNSQRYAWVKEFIETEPSINSITDFGCGNGRINYWIKQIEHVTLINYVDWDIVTIGDALYNFQPPFGELILGRTAKKDLMVKVFRGDVCYPSAELKADCMTMVEVIEHMELSDLEQATRTIFGFYQPKFLIITTPNIEFNHMLKEPDEPPNQFRHLDHKFEWTRLQFAQYGQEVCSRYPYTVHYDGVGHFPGRSEPYGPATQIAVFKRQAPHDPELEKAVEMEWCERKLEEATVGQNKIVRRGWIHEGPAQFELQYKYPGCRRIIDPNEPHYDWW